MLALVVGAVLWLALVPHTGQGADARNPAYWWLAIAAAAGLGAVARSRKSALVGAAVVVPALLLAGWTAPRGDNDGLWILWFPFLAGFLVLLSVVASTTATLADRVTARRRSAPSADTMTDSEGHG
ncbi:MAG TPA: hypothetical protein VFJ85_04290 [Acidimicrobiales bacterium]|nr:hypothetical protein [Acidimicrobiales bacterium]